VIKKIIESGSDLASSFMDIRVGLFSTARNGPLTSTIGIDKKLFDSSRNLFGGA
jgi:hypothetical protein